MTDATQARGLFFFCRGAHPLFFPKEELKSEKKKRR